MAIRNIDGILNHLEEDYENELSFLAGTGAEVFTTADLIRLKGQWQVKHHLFYLLQKRLIYLIAYSPISLAIGFLCYFGFGWVRAGLLVMALFPIICGIVILGFYFLKTQFKGEGHKAWVGQMIDEEIAKRKAKETDH